MNTIDTNTLHTNTNHDAGRLSGVQALYRHDDGTYSGAFLQLRHERPFEPARVRGVDFGLLFKAKPIDGAELEKQAIKERDLQLKLSAWRRSCNVFDIIYRCNVQAAGEEQDKKDAINKIYVRYLTKKSEMSHPKLDEFIGDVKSLTEDLMALKIFEGKYPILSDEEIAAEMAPSNVAA